MSTADIDEGALWLRGKIGDLYPVILQHEIRRRVWIVADLPGCCVIRIARTILPSSVVASRRLWAWISLIIAKMTPLPDLDSGNVVLISTSNV